MGLYEQLYNSKKVEYRLHIETLSDTLVDYTYSLVDFLAVSNGLHKLVDDGIRKNKDNEFAPTGDWSISTTRRFNSRFSKEIEIKELSKGSFMGILVASFFYLILTELIKKIIDVSGNVIEERLKSKTNRDIDTEIDSSNNTTITININSNNNTVIYNSIGVDSSLKEGELYSKVEKEAHGLDDVQFAEKYVDIIVKKANMEKLDEDSLTRVMKVLFCELGIKDSITPNPEGIKRIVMDIDRMTRGK